MRAASLAAALLLAATPALADPVGDFYAGKTISLIVASGEGGYDLYGRLVARHLGAHLPGKPTIIVQNMPGAGGLQAVNHLYSVAAQDGTQIGLVRRGAMVAKLMEMPGVRYDADKFNWIGNVTSETSVSIAWHTAPVKSLDDLFQHELIVGGDGPAATHETLPRLLNGLIGTKFKIVGGYRSSGELFLAMERGEIEGIAYASWEDMRHLKADQLARGDIVVLNQNGLERLPDLPTVPFTMDYIKAEADKQVMRLYAAQDAIPRPILAPPGVAAERVAALRQAFMALGNDNEFAEDAKRAKLDFALMPGEAVQKIVASVAATPPELGSRLAKLTSP
jgi:tripartite-type tricarboxylate transporter receptor subunit TctC